VLLSVLAGHWRYAHMTTLRCDPVNPPLLGMRKVVSEDAVRRGFDKIEEDAGCRGCRSISTIARARFSLSHGFSMSIPP
jgi:hypothetical protein